MNTSTALTNIKKTNIESATRRLKAARAMLATGIDNTKYEKRIARIEAYIKTI